MPRTRTAGDAIDPNIEVMDGQEEIPDWAVADQADQALAVVAPVAAEQYRRKLTPPELLKYVADQVGSYEEDDPRMAMEIAAQIAAAATVDEVLGANETTKGREVLDTVLEINGIKFTVSTKEKGCPYFAVMSVRNTKTNAPDVISVGGWRLVLQLGQLHYMCAELPEGSPFLVARDTPGAIAPESYPLYFKIMKATTSAGREMNYLASPMG